MFLSISGNRNHRDKHSKLCSSQSTATVIVKINILNVFFSIYGERNNQDKYFKLCSFQSAASEIIIINTLKLYSLQSVVTEMVKIYILLSFNVLLITCNRNRQVNIINFVLLNLLRLKASTWKNILNLFLLICGYRNRQKLIVNYVNLNLRRPKTLRLKLFAKNYEYSIMMLWEVQRLNLQYGSRAVRIQGSE